jgi:putative salt-induced outer membrane protein YdiY
MRRLMRPTLVLTGIAVALPIVVANVAARADPPPLTVGVPPPDATALVAAPKAAVDAPKAFTPMNTTSASISLGGQAATGNSKMLAGTANANFEMRRGSDGFGAYILGNYAQSASPRPTSGHYDSTEYATAQNIQGRVRYDRFLTDRFSVFGIVTARNDRFQGLAFRLNVDPGAKYLFVTTDRTTLWGELGYDYEYDYRLDSASIDVPPSMNGPFSQQVSNHSGRAFVGLKEGFTKDVSLIAGLEYLQGFVKSTEDYLDYDSRLNFNALLAANLGAGLSFGVGFTAAWTSHPLPAKTNLDTTETLNLIYAISSPQPPKPPPPPCVPPPPPPLPPPPASPASAPPLASPTPVAPAPTPAAAPSAPATTPPAPPPAP